MPFLQDFIGTIAGVRNRERENKARQQERQDRLRQELLGFISQSNSPVTPDILDLYLGAGMDTSKAGPVVEGHNKNLMAKTEADRQNTLQQQQDEVISRTEYLINKGATQAEVEATPGFINLPAQMKLELLHRLRAGHSQLEENKRRDAEARQREFDSYNDTQQYRAATRQRQGAAEAKADKRYEESQRYQGEQRLRQEKEDKYRDAQRRLDMLADFAEGDKKRAIELDLEYPSLPVQNIFAREKDRENGEIAEILFEMHKGDIVAAIKSIAHDPDVKEISAHLERIKYEDVAKTWVPQEKP